MTSTIGLLFMLVLGLLLGRAWSDLTRAISQLGKGGLDTKRAPWRDVLELVIPKWAVTFVIIVGLITVLIGAAQVYQYAQFRNYQDCQAGHDKNYDVVQRQRSASNLDLTRRRFAYDSTIPALLQPGNTKADLKATMLALNGYIVAADQYFKTVDKNPYPESTVQICGSPKG